MNTKLTFQMNTDNVSPSEVAKMLKDLETFREPRLTLYLLCENNRSAAQFARSVRTKLGEDTPFKLVTSPNKPYVEVMHPEPEIEIQEEPEENEQPLEERPNATRVSEGDFKVRLTNASPTERFGKQYLDITMEICEGSAARSTIQDRVLAWPQNARTEHLAKALGVPSGELLQQIGRCKGKEFLNRRREQLRADGSPYLSNYYFPLLKTPPPVLSGSYARTSH